MKTSIIFDGALHALEKEEQLKKEIQRLKEKGVTPKLVSIVVGDIGGGKFYQNLKKKAAERIGAVIEIRYFGKEIKLVELRKLIKKLNEEKNVHGVMIQLPLPENFSKVDRGRIVQLIKKEKDVDGMRDDGPFLAPVVKAVIEATKGAPPLKVEPYKVVVVGAKGFIGKKIVKALKDMGYEVKGVDIETKDLAKKTKSADILISTTGHEGLIKGGMIRQGAVVIDVGAPKGDVDFNEVSKKASLITPVPGGIGPLNISFLLENLVEAATGIEK
ncbi:bifunctional 5,10-methylenetetrahydrofolate dehydrogenase/5,10-methenyltetrahydrofolate cyclohydrolase [Patescibacteria group bacterium]|nr:bifunctional 5,10-methylenetetrahydrofolate dehydrogenase/5,10-methenyltetrahydrofolate cyclohydrolase [Patescibacteria group bacterium]